jgi:hypothetical protein
VEKSLYVTSDVGFTEIKRCAETKNNGGSDVTRGVFITNQPTTVIFVTASYVIHPQIATQADGITKFDDWDVIDVSWTDDIFIATAELNGDLIILSFRWHDGAAFQYFILSRET